MIFSAKYLKEYGVTVDFYSNEFKPNYDDYDLIHYYNITRPAIILDQHEKSRKKYVITSIFVDYSFYGKTSTNLKMKWLTRLFGTDGIRGKANIYPMTPEVATALGRAVTYYFQKKNKCQKHPLVIIGKDTRLSCYMLEQAFASGVCSQGGRVIFTGPLPTPGVAFVTKSMRADAGVMISASHNSFDDNGIKIFDADGFKLPDEVELILEDLILNPSKMPTVVGGEIGRAKRLEGVEGRYIVHVKTALESNYDMSGMRVVVDCANGASYKVAPMVLSELGAEVFKLGVNPNGENINLNSGSLHPEVARDEVVKLRADLGICLDGDADRVQIIDASGESIDGDRLIGIFAKLMLEKGDLKTF